MSGQVEAKLTSFLVEDGSPGALCRTEQNVHVFGQE